MAHYIYMSIKTAALEYQGELFPHLLPRTRKILHTVFLFSRDHWQDPVMSLLTG